MRTQTIRSLTLLRLPLSLVFLSACADQSSVPGTQGAQAQANDVDVAQLAQAIEDDDQPIDTVTLTAVADTSVRSSNPNKNFGTASTLDVNRGLVMFKQQDILNARVQHGDGVASAKLRLTLVPTLLPRLQRNLEAHRVLKEWTESRATWNCAQDSNTSNNTADCSGATKWSMTGSDAFTAAATGTGVIPSSRRGVVEIDVTNDVKAWADIISPTAPPNFGWLLKTGIGNGGEVADIASRESTTPPQLILQMRRCNPSICDDGNICTDDLRCDPDGFCLRISPPGGATCDDGNDCTLSDICLQFGVCGGQSNAAAGTDCGTGGHCDANGTCIEP